MPFVDLSDAELQLIRDTLQEKADRYLVLGQAPLSVQRGFSEEEKIRNSAQIEWAKKFQQKVHILNEKLKGKVNHDASTAIQPGLISESDIESLEESSSSV